jgi:hypothetical protein
MTKQMLSSQSRQVAQDSASDLAYGGAQGRSLSRRDFLTFGGAARAEIAPCRPLRAGAAGRCGAPAVGDTPLWPQRPGLLQRAGTVRLVGVVAAEPDVRDTYQNLRLRAESMTRLASDGEHRAVWGTVLVRVPRYPARAYGERLAVSGDMEIPPVSEDFSYKREKAVLQTKS